MKNLKRRRRKRLVGALCLAFLLAAAGAGLKQYLRESRKTMGDLQDRKETEETRETGTPVEKAQPSDKVLEDKSVYQEDEEDSVVTMYLTVRRGNKGDNTDHTWAEINEHSAYYYEENGLPRFNCEALLQVGDENGPKEGEFGYGEEASNAAVQIRGQTSSQLEQKNYKIRIKAGKGSWRGQRTLALNKHVVDPLRFTNKLCYDLIKDVPQMIGARTQFVHLYVKDETEGEDSEFVDYGLYTQVEQMNRTYLSNHGLDKKGQLYKINFFEWFRYEDVIMKEDDPAYDEDAFEEYAEIKGDRDHSKLIEVLEAVNDYSVPIGETAEKYFDLDNLFYWAAFHILVGNYDTGARNLYIYSPQNMDKWYFISWDNDSAFRRTYHKTIQYTEGESWERGLTQFTGLVLFKRLFQLEEYRKMLDDAVNDLRENYLLKSRINKKIKAYRRVVEPFQFTEPDSSYFRAGGREQYDFLAKSLASEVEQNYQYYLESLENPWPFYVGMPRVEDGKLHVTWDAAYDPDGENITYSVILARDYEFTDVVDQKENVHIPGIDLRKPEAGTYFLRIRAKNESGYEQDCFDYYPGSGKGKIYGAYIFHIDEKGKITLDDDEKAIGG